MIKYSYNTYLPILPRSSIFSIIINISLKGPQTFKMRALLLFAAAALAFFDKEWGSPIYNMPPPSILEYSHESESHRSASQGYGAHCMFTTVECDPLSGLCHAITPCSTTCGEAQKAAQALSDSFQENALVPLPGHPSLYM